MLDKTFLNRINFQKKYFDGVLCSRFIRMTLLNWGIIHLLRIQILPKTKISDRLTLRKKCPYLELFWSAFSLIRTEYGEMLSISPYSVSMWENADQNNSEYGHLLHSVIRTCAYQRVINISFSDNFAYVLKG